MDRCRNAPAGSVCRHSARPLSLSGQRDQRWTLDGSADLEFFDRQPFYKTNRFYLLCAIGLALALGVIWWLRLRAVQHQFALVIAERARVSREIHDTLLQSLGAIGLELETIASQLDPSQHVSRDALRRLRADVRYSVREARESIMELRSTRLERRDLAEALRDLAAKTKSAEGVQLAVAVSGEPRRCSAETRRTAPPNRTGSREQRGSPRAGHQDPTGPRVRPGCAVAPGDRRWRGLCAVGLSGRYRRAHGPDEHEGARRENRRARSHLEPAGLRHRGRRRCAAVIAAGGAIARVSTPAIRVLCVDDHRLMREGIMRVVGLQPDMTVVAQASNGEEAVEQFLQHRPDVTLMDLQVPRVNGLQAIRAIRHAQPDARIIVLTMYHGDEDIYRALQAGAVGYLLKDTVPEDLSRVIREVHAGHRRIPPDVAATLAARAKQPG